jgi:predicted phosphodiesterase
MPRKLDDAAFTELWKTHKSAAKVAKASGLSIRAVQSRRRSIEQRYHQPLAGAHHTAHNFANLSPRLHKPRLDLGIENGIVIVGSDAHIWPHQRTTAMAGFIKLVKELGPKAVVLNGDVFDGASVSRWPRIGWDNTPTVKEELHACQETLGEIEDVAGRAKLVWCLGNHDSRFEVKLAAQASQYEGVQGFHLKDHFPKWAPTWSVWVGESTVIKHRWHNGLHAVYNNTLKSGKTIITGHLHSLKVTPFSDYSGTRYGVDTGTLAEPGGPQFMDYLEQNPTNWRSGFVILTFHKGRLLWPEICHVLDQGVLEFRGQIIKV